MGLSVKRKIGQSMIVNDDLEVMVTAIKNKEVQITFFGDENKYRVIRTERFSDEGFRQKLEANRKKRNDET